MEGETTLQLPSVSVSGSNSPSNKLPRKSAPKYSACQLYNTEAARVKLTGLSVATCNPSIEDGLIARGNRQDEMDDMHFKVSIPDKTEYMTSDKMSCSFCGVEFASRHEQKVHYRSDWHRFNLKQRIKGLNSVSEESFEILSGNISSLSGSDSDSDVSDTESDVPRSKPLPIPARLRQSLYSGSDSDSESTCSSYSDRITTRKYPKIYLRNSTGEIISIYRCLLYHKKSPLESQTELLSAVTSLPERMRWAVLMAGGGHFAGAIFHNGAILQHKTFHRYVVRAKRGSAQGSRDSQGSAPKSGGASLRRYNEAALMQEIQDLLNSWDDLLKKCDLIFLRAPSFNRQIFFGGKNPALKKSDMRIRVIPFPTRRATFNEVRRIHEMLSSIESYGEEEEIQEFVPMSPRRHLSPDSGKLELLTDDIKSLSPKKKSPKGKTGLSPLSQSPSEEGQQRSPRARPSKSTSSLERCLSPASLGSSASDIDLVELNEEISMLSHKLFEVTRKPQKKKQKRRRKPSSHHQIEPESNIQDEEKYHLKNSLYTACKIGDIEALKSLLAIFIPPSGQSEIRTVKTSQSSTSTSISQSGVCAEDPSDESNSMRENHSSQSNELKENSQKPADRKLTSDDPSPENKSTKSPESGQNIELTTARKSDPSTILSKKLDVTHCPANMEDTELPSPVVSKDILNEVIGDSRMTLLHVAGKEGHKSLIGPLLEAGADPSIRDRFGVSSFSCSKSKEVRNEFRRFMAKCPDMYDYQKAEIPGPLTEDMERERRQKDAERKKAQKKAKHERLKDRKEEEAQQRAEEMEQKRFLSLSDREKRALAAERRQIEKAQTSGQNVPVLLRCWRCAKDITGKVPFEYHDYKFCSTKCLKEHRLQPAPKPS